MNYRTQQKAYAWTPGLLISQKALALFVVSSDPSTSYAAVWYFQAFCMLERGSDSTTPIFLDRSLPADSSCFFTTVWGFAPYKKLTVATSSMNLPIGCSSRRSVLRMRRARLLPQYITLSCHGNLPWLFFTARYPSVLSSFVSFTHVSCPRLITLCIIYPI